MVINITQMAQISGKESVLIVKVEDHKHFGLGNKGERGVEYD